VARSAPATTLVRVTAKPHPLIQPASPEALSFQRRDEQTARMIKKYGWEVQGVENSGGWAYTVGLVDKGRPELLLLGVNPQSLACGLLNRLAQKMVALDRDLVPGECFRVEDQQVHVLDTVPQPGATPQAVRWYGNRLRVVEVGPCGSGRCAPQDA
jgi:hypothetical protein